jgi:MFS family permease
MRWLELLVAGIFTYEVTQSAFLVALVIVARSLPMLLIGSIAGVIGEALNRKRLLVTQLLVLAASSAVLCVLAFSEQILVWHVALGGLVAGIVWAMELAVRRRMLGEVVVPDQIGPAVAFDSLTNSVARVLGPLAGGAVFQTLGLGGAYLLSTVLYLLAGLVVGGLDFRQESRKLRFSRIPIEIVEGLAVARANQAILAVVLVSIIMNMFAFSYSALIAPIGLDLYGVSPILVGALAAAEPLGSIAAGIALSAGWLRLNGSRALLRGSLLFLASSQIGRATASSGTRTRSSAICLKHRCLGLSVPETRAGRRTAPPNVGFGSAGNGDSRTSIVLLRSDGSIPSGRDRATGWVDSPWSATQNVTHGGESDGYFDQYLS